MIIGFQRIVNALLWIQQTYVVNFIRYLITLDINIYLTFI